MKFVTPKPGPTSVCPSGFPLLSQRRRGSNTKLLCLGQKDFDVRSMRGGNTVLRNCQSDLIIEQLRGREECGLRHLKWEMAHLYLSVSYFSHLKSSQVLADVTPSSRAKRTPGSSGIWDEYDHARPTDRIIKRTA